MHSVLGSSAGQSHSTKEYAPLADEVNPPFGNVAPAPTVARNGTIVYSKRLSSTGSGSSGNGSPLARSDSDDTLKGKNDRKGKGRASFSHSGLLEDDDGDIGSRAAHHVHRKTRQDARAYGQTSAAEYETASASYPPLNEAEEEEKRVQATLAKFAARDQARRKAARLSKTMSTGSPLNSRRNSSAGSSSSSLARSQVSPLSSISESKRSSVLGVVGNLIGGKDKTVEENEVPLSPVSAPPRDRTQAYDNPYVSPRQATSERPTMMAPPSMTASGPFADPPSVNGSVRPGSPHNPNLREDPSPTADGNGDFGYLGPGWRGGAAHRESTPRRERWWHALCAWGADLDGGDSNQAGRTNPME